MAKCANCGTALVSPDEPCPNCLPRMAWRPPTRQGELLNMGEAMSSFRAELDKVKESAGVIPDLESAIHGLRSSLGRLSKQVDSIDDRVGKLEGGSTRDLEEESTD